MEDSLHLQDVYVDSIGVQLGTPIDLAESVREGRYNATEYEANGLVGARVSTQAPPDMAVEAVRQALATGTVRPEEVTLMLHASLYFQGKDMWTPASYIQERTIGGHAPSVEVDQKSSGGLAALALALAYLQSCPPQAAVLVTTADRFCDPGWDRFRSESGTVMADGATATMLSRRPGVARVLSMVMTADPSLEEMYRGKALTDRPASGDRPLDLRARKLAYMKGRIGDLGAISDRIAFGVRDCMLAALADAGRDLNDVTRVVLPNVGMTVRWWSVLAEAGIEIERTTWDFGRTIGHLGAGDQANGLHHLITTGAVRPGDTVVLAGSGHGFNWGCAVVEVLDAPAQ